MQLPGALALAAAGAATTANGATVQITFSNSFLSTNDGNHLVTDFGGDGQADIGGRFPVLIAMRPVYLVSVGGATLAAASGNVMYGRAGRMGAWSTVQGAPAAAVSIGLVSFTLHDSGVNGGAGTSGWLDVVATGRSSGEFGRIEVLRFIFDDVVGSPAPTGVSHASGAFAEFGAAVPEPSGLGLLALGAVGVVARRRRAVAA